MLQKFDKWNKMKLHPMLFCGIMTQEFSGVHPAGKKQKHLSAELPSQPIASYQSVKTE